MAAVRVATVRVAVVGVAARGPSRAPEFEVRRRSSTVGTRRPCKSLLLAH